MSERRSDNVEETTMTDVGYFGESTAAQRRLARLTLAIIADRRDAKDDLVEILEMLGVKE